MKIWTRNRLRRACLQALQAKGLDGALWFDKKQGKKYSAVFWVSSIEHLFATQVENTRQQRISIEVGEYTHI